MGISGGVAEGEGVVVQITAAISGLISGMAESAGVVEAGTEEMGAAFEALGSIINVALAPLLLFTAAVEGLHVFVEAIEHTTELAVQLEVLHEKTGMSVESLSALKYVADLSHVSFEQVAIALQRLARNMETAAKGGAGPAAQAFKDMGIAVADAAGHLRPMGDVMLQVADRFHGMEDGAKKTAIAMDIFGRSGANMIPMLNLGREGIQKLEEEAQRLGIVLTQDNVGALIQYHDSLVELKAAWGGLVLVLATSVMPVLDGLARFLTAVIDVLRALGNALKAIVNFLLLDWTSAWENGKGAVERLKDAWTAMSTVPDPTPGGKVGGENLTTHPKVKETISALEKLEQALREYHANHLESLETIRNYDVNFWKDQLDSLDKGSKEYIEVYKKWVDAVKAQKDGLASYNEAINKRTQRTDENSGDLAGALAAANKQLAQATAQYGAMSKEAVAALNNIDAVRDKMAKQWTSTFESITGAFSRTITSLIQTGGTFRDFMGGVFRQLAASFAESEFKMVEVHAAAWLAQRNITTQGVTEKVALNAWAAIKIIAMEAASAAAAAWAAIAGIPFVGPFLAPAAAAAALAGVLALAGTIHSAAGGFDIPAGLNPITQLHAQEMVLPKQYANVIRGMADNGGGGRGDVHLHVHTMDAGGVRQFLMTHKEAVASAAHSAASDGMAFRSQIGRHG